MKESIADGSSAHRQGRGRSKLTARFFVALGEELGADDLTPAVVARAVVRVLPVDAAGFSTLAEHLRVPLGASDERAAKAEELQTSLGEGPCLDAASRKAPVALNTDDLNRRWPRYAAELRARTPFRSVAAMPLYAPGHGVFAALDLYSTRRQLAEEVDLIEAEQHVGRPAAAIVHACLADITSDAPDDRPAWYAASAGRRHDVWVAMGIVMNTRRVGPPDALRLLRAEAGDHDRSLDELATDIIGATPRPPVPGQQ